MIESWQSFDWMKYFTRLIRWISSQEHLYFLFALLFIIPNCVFFFTEPLPVTVGIASLLIPLAFWMCVLLVARKPGIVVWCLLPKVILDGGQLVLLYLFGQSVIAVDMYWTLPARTLPRLVSYWGISFWWSVAYSFSIHYLRWCSLVVRYGRKRNCEILSGRNGPRSA